jgi:hypothetical protein
MTRNYQLMAKPSLELVAEAVRRWCLNHAADSALSKPESKLAKAVAANAELASTIAEGMTADLYRLLPPIGLAMNYAYFAEREAIAELDAAGKTSEIETLVVATTLSHITTAEYLAIPETDEANLMFWVAKYWPIAAEIYSGS